jgi:hypothetical protein
MFKTYKGGYKIIFIYQKLEFIGREAEVALYISE